MAKIDKMLEMMSARRVERALLVSDRTIQLYSNTGIIDGPYVTNAQLKEILAEVVPSSYMATFQGGGALQFLHQSPSGAFNIAVENFAGSVQATVTPLRSEIVSTAVMKSPEPATPPTIPSPWNVPQSPNQSPYSPPSLPTSPYAQQIPQSAPTGQPQQPLTPYQPPVPSPYGVPPQGYSQPAQPYGTPPSNYPPSGYPGYPQPHGYGAPVLQSHRSKLAGGLLGIFLGGLGIHRFYLGYTTTGVIYLLATLVFSWLTCGISAALAGILGLIEGIIILSGGMKDAEGRELAS